MKTGSKKTLRIWSYHGASKTLPYVRMVLGSLRIAYVAAWHLSRLSEHDPARPDLREEMLRRRQDGIDALEELGRLSVLSYERPSRGIALFPFVVDGSGRPRGAYYVFKDSRDTIDSFIFKDDLCEHNDLYRDEKPVPQAWKQTGVVPKLEETDE